MGLRYAFLIYSRDGQIDLTKPKGGEAADEVIRKLFPRTPYERSGTVRLLDACFPEPEHPIIGVFDDGVLIATRDAHLYDPDILHKRYKTLGFPDIQLITSRSYNAMVAYGRWRNGELVRCLSMNAVAGVWRDAGDRGSFDGQIEARPDRWLDVANFVLADALALGGDAAPRFDNAIDWDDVEVHSFSRANRSKH